MHFHFAAQQSRFRLVSSQKISFESRDLLETQILAHFVCTHLLLIDLIYQLFSIILIYKGQCLRWRQAQVQARRSSQFFCHWEPKKVATPKVNSFCILTFGSTTRCMLVSKCSAKMYGGEYIFPRQSRLTHIMLLLSVLTGVKCLSGVKTLVYSWPTKILKYKKN